jgi:hypothetical protein
MPLYRPHLHPDLATTDPQTDTRAHPGGLVDYAASAFRPLWTIVIDLKTTLQRMSVLESLG